MFPPFNKIILWISGHVTMNLMGRRKYKINNAKNVYKMIELIVLYIKSNVLIAKPLVYTSNGSRINIKICFTGTTTFSGWF